MRILFVTKPHLPAVGGAQLTTHFLAEELVGRGHDVTVFAQQPPFDAPHPPRDTSYGYLVLRSSETERDLPGVVAAHGPDCVVVGGYHQEIASWADTMLAGAAPVATVLYAHDVGATVGARDRAPEAGAAAAVSRFVAEALAAQGIDAAVVPPIVDPRRYRVRSTRRVVLFVNPVRKKGVALALALAEARPDIPFAFVRCWHIPTDELTRLRRRIDALDNVELRDSVDDPALLYGDARVVLVPSSYPEAWGRVAAEAVAAGVPVLASRIGGLPEAVGDGGMSVEPDAPVAEWAHRLGQLWDDLPTYDRYVTRARAAGRTRRDTSAGAVGSSFEAVVARAIASNR